MWNCSWKWPFPKLQFLWNNYSGILVKTSISEYKMSVKKKLPDCLFVHKLNSKQWIYKTAWYIGNERTLLPKSAPTVCITRTENEAID